MSAQQSRPSALPPAAQMMQLIWSGAMAAQAGGGHGRLLHSILSTVPSLHGVLYDLPEVVADAVFLDSDVASGRAKIIGGSFLQNVPAGADAYILSGVINDWNDNNALTILRNCRKAISNNGRLLLATTA